MSAQIGPVAYAFALKGKRDRWCKRDRWWPLLAIIRHLKGVFKSWSSYFKSDRDGEDKIEFKVTCLNGQNVSTRFGLIKSRPSALEELFLPLFQRQGMLCCTRCQLMNSCLFLHHFMYLMYVCYFFLYLLVIGAGPERMKWLKQWWRFLKWVGSIDIIRTLNSVLTCKGTAYYILSLPLQCWIESALL